MDKTCLQILKILDTFTQKLSGLDDLNFLAREVHKIVEGIFPEVYTSLYLYDTGEGRLQLLFSAGLDKKEKESAESTAMERHPGHVLKTGERILVSDAANDPLNFSANSPYRFTVRSGVYIPVKNNGTTIGVLEVVGEGKNRFSGEDAILLSFISNLAGSIYGYIRTMNEILKAKDAIEHLSSFPVQNPNPVIRISMDGIVLFANPASTGLLKARDCYVGKKVTPDLQQLLDKARGSNAVFETEMNIGDKYYLMVFDPQPEHHYINIYGQEITDRKLAEKELKKHALIARETDNALIITDKHGRVEWVNRGFTRITEYSLEEIKGKKPGDVLQGPKTDPKTIDRIARAIKMKEPVETDILNYTKSGREYWVQMHIQPVFGDNNQILNFISIQSDITEKKLSEIRLKEAKEKAEEASKTKERFLANMSHEIRTPMNTVHGMVQLLENTELDNEQKNYVESIHLSSHNLLHIIDDILDMSKIESDILQLEQKPFNLNILIRKMVRSLEYIAVEKSLLLTHKVDDRIAPVLMGDSSRLNQILLNLLGNAIKFTTTGYVRINCRLEQENETGNKVLFSIEDSGQGISRQNLENIFEPFRQEDDSHTRTAGGTGLGLAISKRLIDLMGGEIRVHSERDKGSKFWFVLEFAKGLEQDLIELERKAIVDPDILRGKRILLAEDNRFNQKIVEINVKKWNAELDIVDNGLKAVQAARDKNYDLIIMDKQMPVMDGILASRKIRGELGKSIPILALTANVMKEVIEECYDSGMDDYLAKPFEQDVLFEKVCILLGKEVSYSIPENISSRGFEKEIEGKALFRLDSLKALGDDPEFIKSSLTIFIKLSEEGLRDLNEAFRKKDYQALERKAHFLKSNILQLQIDVLKPVVIDIMKFSLQEPMHDQLPPLIEKMNIVLGKVIETIKKEYDV